MKYATMSSLVLLVLAVAAVAAAFEQDIFPSLVPVDEQQTSSIDSRIINGQHAQPTQFPWHVAITGVQLNSQRVLCGGALISANHVLTSAQCVNGPT